jgi:hypothetical protein
MPVSDLSHVLQANQTEWQHVFVSLNRMKMFAANHLQLEVGARKASCEAVAAESGR